MLKKKFLKTKCKVTFEVPDGISDSTDTVYLVGDFNNWDERATPLEKKKSSYAVTLDLELDKEYQFRYLVNEHTWHNDWEADKYVPNPFHGDNSVVITYSSNGHSEGK
jgi:1,4-alpha-glucan branching enzyme